MKKSVLASLVFLMGAGMSYAQEGRPPIALPGAAFQQNLPPQAQSGNTPAPMTPPDADLSELDMQTAILSMSRAIAQSGCVVTAQNRANVLSLSSLSAQEGGDTIALMMQSGLVSRSADNQSLILSSCTPPNATPTSPQQSPQQPAAAPQKEPLTLLQRRRCADIPTLPFCG